MRCVKFTGVLKRAVMIYDALLYSLSLCKSTENPAATAIELYTSPDCEKKGGNSQSKPEYGLDGSARTLSITRLGEIKRPGRTLLTKKCQVHD